LNAEKKGENDQKNERADTQGGVVHKRRQEGKLLADTTGRRQGCGVVIYLEEENKHNRPKTHPTKQAQNLKWLNTDITSDNRKRGWATDRFVGCSGNGL